MTPSLGAYDMILGRDFMQTHGIDLRFSNATIEWDSKVIPFSDADDVLETSHSNDSQLKRPCDGTSQGLNHEKFIPRDTQFGNP